MALAAANEMALHRREMTLSDLIGLGLAAQGLNIDRCLPAFAG
jgi:hypothetical protein